IGDCAEGASLPAGTSVLRVDRAMAEAAVAIGGTIGVVAALESTLAPTEDLLRSVAGHVGAEVTLRRILCTDAWPLFEAGDLRTQLVDIVLGSPAVPSRRDQRAAVGPLMEAFFEGLGDRARDLLSANLGRAGARLVRLVSEEQRTYMTTPSYQEVVELREFAPARATDREVSGDRHGSFSRSLAYDGWKRALFPVEWFDSRPERTVANMVDEDAGVACWVRLHVRELPILWNSAGQEYNPDLIVIDTDGSHWVVEVKMDKEMDTANVKGKRDAALRWANYVSADEQVGVPWRYLLVSEADIETAKGSWPALKILGRS
ncbi:MAG: hypothetical protein WKF56_09540, partial [Candidatus Limnocylindrales bacterium]